MDNSKLLGPTLPTEGTVLAKRLKPLPGPPTPNFLVAIWIELREAPQGMGFFVLWMPYFLLLGLAGVTRGLTLLGVAFFIYLELSARRVWHPSWFAWLFAEKEKPRPSYAEAVKMIQESPNETERNSTFLGWVCGTDWPVLLDDELLRENVHITGPTRVGKSKRTKNVMARQKISRKKDVFVFLDLGGDPTDVHEMREAAEAAGIPFYLFTIDPENDSHGFNPIAQSHIGTHVERGGLLAQGLGLVSPSQEYGKWYFSSQTEKLSVAEFREFARPTIMETMAEIEKLPLGELANRLKLSARDIEHGMHINLELRKLAAIAGLNAPDSPHSIDFKRIIQEGPAVVYFFLPVGHNLTAAVSTARMAIHAVSGAAMSLPRNHTPVVVVIDEAQSVVGMGLQSFYQQIAKFGVSIWTIHQNFQDLMNVDKNVLPMVVNNAAVGIHLGARDAIGKEHIESAGGRIKSYRKTTTSEGRESVTEMQECRISTEDFESVNSYKELAFVTIGGLAGFCSFKHTFICWLPSFSCSWEDYQRYLTLQWPKLEDGVCMINILGALGKMKEPPKKPKEMAAQAHAALAAMAAAHARN